MLHLHIQCSLPFVLLTAWQYRRLTSYRQNINIENTYECKRAERASLENFLFNTFQKSYLCWYLIGYFGRYNHYDMFVGCLCYIMYIQCSFTCITHGMALWTPFKLPANHLHRENLCLRASFGKLLYFHIQKLLSFQYFCVYFRYVWL